MYYIYGSVWAIPTYRVYRLYDIHLILLAVDQVNSSSVFLRLSVWCKQEVQSAAECSRLRQCQVTSGATPTRLHV